MVRTRLRRCTAGNVASPPAHPLLLSRPTGSTSTGRSRPCSRAMWALDTRTWCVCRCRCLAVAAPEATRLASLPRGPELPATTTDRCRGSSRRRCTGTSPPPAAAAARGRRRFAELTSVLASPQTKHEWAVNQHRDSIASHLGHSDLMSYFAVAQGESVGRVRYQLLEKMLQVRVSPRRRRCRGSRLAPRAALTRPCPRACSRQARRPRKWTKTRPPWRRRRRKRARALGLASY